MNNWHQEPPEDQEQCIECLGWFAEYIRDEYGEVRCDSCHEARLAWIEREMADDVAALDAADRAVDIRTALRRAG